MSTIVDDRRLLAACSILFLGSAVATVLLCRTMAGGMPMPGGWTMSMAWMRMPGQSWLAAAFMFVGMWAVMMPAMMIPSLAPSLSWDRRSIVVGGAYFAAWTLFGIAVYPIGLALANAEMRSPSLSRSVPMVTGVVIALAGAFQMTSWKAGQLRQCRESGCAPSAWRHGTRLGVRCILCCTGFMIVLLVSGVMDLWVMAVVTGGITAERLASKPEIVARAIGAATIVTGVVLAGRAMFG